MDEIKVYSCITLMYKNTDSTLLQTNDLTINSNGKDYIHTEAIRVKYGSGYLVRMHATQVSYMTTVNTLESELQRFCY
jgi:hypothetical protein